jgi:hypothetical protein
MPSEDSSVALFTNSGSARLFGPAGLAAPRHHEEVGHAHAMVRGDLLGDDLAARQEQPARIAARVGQLQQFQVADHVRVEVRDAVELLEQVEHHFRLPLLGRHADRVQLVLHAERSHLVAELAQRADDTELGLPAVHLLGGLALERIGRHQRGVHEHEDAERLPHSATQLRRE